MQREGSPRPQVSFAEFQARRIQTELSPFPALSGWLSERIRTLPEMQVAKSPLTNEKWKAQMAEGGEVEQINGSFFTVEGVRVQTPKFSWDQPSVQQTGTILELSTPDGAISAQVSGIVGVIKDNEGNILVTVGQEPLSDGPNHAVVKTPLQTSATKFMDVKNGETQKDTNMVAFLTTLYGDNAFDAFLAHIASGEVEVFPLASADANRIHATNIGIAITLADEAKKQALVADGTNRWISKAEYEGLIKTGLLNGHTIAAVTGAKS